MPIDNPFALIRDVQRCLDLDEIKSRVVVSQDKARLWVLCLSCVHFSLLNHSVEEAERVGQLVSWLQAIAAAESVDVIC
jgi:hypothetical protein